MAVLSAIRASASDPDDLDTEDVIQKLRDRAKGLLGLKKEDTVKIKQEHANASPPHAVHSDVRAFAEVITNQAKDPRTSADERGVEDGTHRTRHGLQHVDTHSRRHPRNMNKAMGHVYDSYRPHYSRDYSSKSRHAKKMARRTQRSELVHAQEPPVTAHDLKKYSDIVESRGVPFKNGNGKLNPSAYGSTLDYDLGLCYATFFTLQRCEHGVHCAWRHHPLTDEEKRWIHHGLDSDEFVPFADGIAQKKAVAEPTFSLGAWLLREGLIRSA